MSARFQAGDIAGAKELAKLSLRAAKEERWWSAIDESLGYQIDLDITYVNFLLGRIALKEGDLVTAKKHLLGAVQPITGNALHDYWLRSKMDVSLPAELLAAGERDTVIKFVDLVKKSALDWEASTRGTPKYRQDTIFESEARNRMNPDDSATFFDHWRKDVAAGGVPQEWNKRTDAPSPAAASASVKPLPTHQAMSLLVREVRFVLTQLQYPLGFQMLGCVLAIPIFWRQPRCIPGVSLRAAVWLSAFGVLCIIEGTLLFALYWGAFGVALRFSLKSLWLHELFALAVGMVLWEIRRALRGETMVGRMTVLIRASLLYLTVYFLLKNTLTDMDGLAPEYVYFMTVLAVPLLWVIPISIALGVAWEFWQWTKRNTPLPFRAKWCLYLAAPIFGAQVFTVSWPILAGTHFISRPVAVSALWLNVLLPWLLVGGFAAVRRQSGKTGPSPAAATP